MRKIGWWLVPALFVFALGCGGGGQGPTSGGGPTGGVEPAIPEGYGLIVVNIHQAQTAAPVEGPRALAVPAAATPAPDHVRIAARLVQTITVPILDDNGTETGETTQVTTEVYRKIVDAPLGSGTTTVPIAVPAADGYMVEVVSYANRIIGTDNVNVLLKYVKTEPNINVVAGLPTSTPALTATQITADLMINPPDNVISGNQYSIAVGIDNTPLRAPFMFQQFVDTVGNVAPTGFFVFDNSSKVPIFTAQNLTTRPSPAVDHWDLYFQGLFYLGPTWQSQAELNNLNWYKKFVFYYPNPLWGDLPLFRPLYPLGTVNIDITLSPSR
jgi:hypothetical protein